MQVQDIVVGNKNFTDVTKPSEIVQLLLNEDQLASLDGANASVKGKGKSVPSSTQANGNAVRDLWNDEGDEFFGQPASAQPGPGSNADGADDDSAPPAPISTGRGRGRRRKGEAAATRGHKPGPGRGRGRRKAQMVDVDGE